MNKKMNIFFILFALSLVIGVGLTLLWKNPIQSSNANILSRQTTGILTNEEKILDKKEKQLNDLNKLYRKLENELKIEKDILSEDEAAQYKKLRMFLGAENIVGEGIIIKIESIDENNNLAFEFDSNKTLLKILNLAKTKDAEYLAINNQYISNRTGIVLAGNHININDIPISPPYEIKILGNEKKLYRYFMEESVLMLTLEQSNTVNINIEKSRKITIPKIKTYARLDYLQETK